MATLSITNAQTTPAAIRGINVDPVVFYSWDIKSLFPSAAAGDVIETPVFDLNAVAPNTNRLITQKQVATASADTLKLMVSADGITWYTAPLYYGTPSASIAVSNTNGTDVSLTRLPTLRFVKAQLTLATAISSQASARLGLTLSRI